MEESGSLGEEEVWENGGIRRRKVLSRVKALAGQPVCA